jgi:hypothetical protein
MGTLVVNVHEHPYWENQVMPDGRIQVPGLGLIRADVNSGTRNKFFGDPETGPFIYLLEVPAGTKINRHSHKADRLEFLIEGEIEWQEDDGAVTTYGAGTLTYVTAGTFYQYQVLKDAKILLTFYGRPGDSRATE